MIDKSNTTVPDYGTKIMTLILGILNVDRRVEHTITQIDDDKTTPITNPNIGNDKIHINVPDWIKTAPTLPFNPNPYPPQVWYNHETEPLNARDGAQEVRYTTNTTYTGDKNMIVDGYTYDSITAAKTSGNGCVTTQKDVPTTYTKNNTDFRDEQEQSTFKDK